MKLRYFFVGFALMFIMQRLEAQNPWKIEAEHFSRDNYFGVTIANGMLGIVSSPDPLKSSNVVLAGSYDNFARGRVSNFMEGFNMLNTLIAIDQEEIEFSNISLFKQNLDMRKASFNTSFQFEDKAIIETSMQSLRQLPFCAMQTIIITPLKDIKLYVANQHETPKAFRDPKMMTNDIKSELIRLITTQAKSPSGKFDVCASSTFLFPNAEKPRLTHSIPDNDLHLAEFQIELKKGQVYEFSVVGATLTSEHHPDPLNEAERLTIYAALEGYDRLVSRHNSLWDELWKSDIVIEGDNQAQQDVHSMMYHLYSFVREGSRLSISPMGLSGLGYNGHVFWDADIWMFPALLVLHPELAVSFIDYRYDRLDAAKLNAWEHGYRGAQYVWESAATGVEETPVWALSGPFEHHISGCVAFAAWQYYCVTQDKEWLKDVGYPIISQTADFWVSRVEKDDTGYHIRNVVCADEWAENVDDNAFTNAVAIMNLEIALKSANIIGLKGDSKWSEYSKVIPIHKMKNGVIAEYLGYDGEKIKQADVNLLAYPLSFVTDKKQIKKDLDYYTEKVPSEGTPAMTQSVFSLLYSRLGDGEKADFFFRDAYLENLCPPFRVIAECKGGRNPYFITGAGGVLQTVIMGFCGLNITEDGISQSKDQVLPKGWKSVTVTNVGSDNITYTWR